MRALSYGKWFPIATKANRLFMSIQHRHTSSKSEMENFSSNPYFNKYADKLAAAQQSSPEEFQRKIDSYFQKPVVKEKQSLSKGFTRPGMPKLGDSASYLQTKKLNSVLKVESVKDLSADDITQIWKVHHQNKDKISAVIPAKVYNTIFERSKQYSTFLYPLPRDQGYEFIMAQFSGHECHFTSLVNFQAFKENAPECLTIIHYTELQEDKGIVLMHGEFNKEAINVTDACFLANELQLYYNAPENSKKFKLLSTFNNDPNNFKHMDLVNELANLSLS